MKVIENFHESHRATATHLISREIGIDAGHRVTDHNSKCRNLHGHRYAIQAWCRGPLFSSGEQCGMVLDFSFLKDEMMSQISVKFDHAFIFWMQDALCRTMFGLDDDCLGETVDLIVKQEGFFAGSGRGGSKICVVPFVPTAECLARFWFSLIAPRVIERSSSKACLVCVKVWETPNCWAAYGPEAGVWMGDTRTRTLEEGAIY